VPTLEQNREWWAERDWEAEPGNWSVPWGSPVAQWHVTLRPRIALGLRAGTTLEIAPGYGRWTQFLLPESQRYIGVDLSERCVQSCQARFARAPHAEFHANDGRSLPMVTDASVDFVFSFDSLVHADARIMTAYLQEIGRVLRTGGTAFLHHSNMAMYSRRRKLAGWLKRMSGRRGAALSQPSGPVTGRRRTSPLLSIEQRAIRAWQQSRWSIFGTGSRSEDVSAAIVRRLAADAGLHVRSQELITWAETGLLSDCLTVLQRPDGRLAAKTRVVKNRSFMDEARTARRLASLYLDDVTDGV
jgi:SAM-dependent methyltransferase